MQQRRNKEANVIFANFYAVAVESCNKFRCQLFPQPFETKERGDESFVGEKRWANEKKKEKGQLQCSPSEFWTSSVRVAIKS